MTFGIPGHGRGGGRYRGGGGGGGGGGRFAGKWKSKGNGFKKAGNKSTWVNHAARGSTDKDLPVQAEWDDNFEMGDPMEEIPAPDPTPVEEAVPKETKETSWETANSFEARIEEIQARDELDEKLGFWRYREGPEKLGWMVNMHPTLVLDEDWPTGKAAIDLYFLEEDGGSFKATVIYEPYFYIMCKHGKETDVEEYIRRRFSRIVLSCERVEKEDLSLPNHLLGHKRTLLKLKFWNMQNLLQVRRALLPAAERNQKKLKTSGAYEEIAEYTNRQQDHTTTFQKPKNPLDFILELREYDVSYYTRAAIDCDLRVGLWYNVKAIQSSITLTPRPDKVKRADPVVLAFDIETTKLPLKFPDANVDSIMMISYMIDGQGFLITNREIVSEDIEDFEYTPKPEYEGPFTIFNEPNEASLIRRFFEHIRDARPTVFVTYNGDGFDWPFVDRRAEVHGISMKEEIGFSKDVQGEYKSFYAIHMDALCWVKRDSYLPQGSQGLKAVTTAKLGYNPMEIDPEDMTRFAAEEPQTLAQYSVSDAVATYYLYMKYVHPFIFSLCNIIPMNPDDVLRKGSGTLCETLLMVQSYQANVIMPNKHTDKVGQFFEGHLLESETYVGGHVEALEAGVFRSDLPAKFRLVPEAFQQLIDEIDAALKFSIVVEGKLTLEDVANYEEVKAKVIEPLQNLRDTPNRLETPSIYHLDVAAMYPNIILTNRLQPDAIVEEEMCAACDFNGGPGSTCQRNMTWSWRGEFYSAKRSEYSMILNQLEQEKFGKKDRDNDKNKDKEKDPSERQRPFHELRQSEQQAEIKKRLSTYSRKVYNKIRETKVVPKESIVCQRENPFYVNTVRAFRDRRYEYKGLLKTWKKKLDDATADGDLTKIDEAKKLIVVYDSLQLAHKCILNSFYGYVMRKGARWYSMEMAGIVCLTGAKIIQLARQRIEQIGRPLELDTDGIWCIFPATFPENFTFKLKNGKIFPISYPCVMLNHLVHDQFTNHQYQELEDPQKKRYSTRSENSIFFEVDGPYRAMILPSSTEEDKLLKKRYAVFNDDGSLAELKGFEVKRRGELKLIKIFQSQIFKVFLEGGTLDECYGAVAAVANQWLDVIFSKGAHLDDNELFDLISENRSMSKSLEDYGMQKSTSISTARRLAEFLGDQMVRDKGLNCKFVISAKPHGLAVSERAIPVAIFQAEEGVRKHYLRKWLRDTSLTTFDIRDILDWQYYLERFGSVIQKLITIPAAMQGVPNPVPRIKHPDWLHKRVAAMNDKTRQFKITDMFKRKEVVEEDEEGMMVLDDPDDSDLENGTKDVKGKGKAVMADLEDIGSRKGEKSVLRDGRIVPVVHKTSKVLGKRKRRLPPPRRYQEDYSMLPACDHPENMPDARADYGAWLQFQKRKWKRRRAQREMHKALFGALEGDQVPQPGLSSGTLGVEAFFRQHTRNILSSSWQILQLAETDIPGDFRVWALVGGNLHALKMTVPRVFYINSRMPDPDEKNKRPDVKMVRTVRTLPRSRPCFHFYEVTMPEPTYQEMRSDFKKMKEHDQIEGIYETQVPVVFRALLKLGCIAAVDRKRVLSGRGLEDGFTLDEINHKDMDWQNRYLPAGTRLHYLYLFHAAHGSRQILGLFSTVLKRAWVFVVDPGKNKDAISNLKRMFAEKLGEKRAGVETNRSGLAPSQSIRRSRGGVSTEPNIIPYSEEMEITATFHGTEIEAMVAVSRTLREYQEQRRGATILAVRSPRATRQLLLDGISLINDFPVIKLPCHNKEDEFPALGWQQLYCKRMMAQYLALNDFLKERIALSRYADVPFCNIESDYTAFLTDLGVARRLKRADMILWYSQAEKPDLGGREVDIHQVVLSELIDPEINVPGCYDSVCMEIKIWDLTLNAFMQSTLLDAADGVGGPLGGSARATGRTIKKYIKGTETEMPAKGTNGGGGDDSQVTPASFSIIKSLIMGWADEVKRKNRFASYLLEHLYRWLTSKQSRMYDPALYAQVQNLMRRMFVQLVAEFKRLGGRIIYASFEKIVVATTKVDLTTAVGYGKYILEAICRKKIFETLDLRTERYWRFMTWMNTHDYGGLLCENSVELLRVHAAARVRSRKGRTFVMEQEEIVEKIQPVLTTDMEWNMGDYLPPAVQPLFAKIVGEYMYELQAFKQKELETMALAGENQVIPTGDSNPTTIFLRELVSTKLKRKVLKIVPDIVRKHEANPESPDYKFPVLPGAHFEMKEPALEFIKSVCAILGMHEGIDREVRMLKRDLLTMIGKFEYLPENHFVTPCEPFILRQVVCEFCNHAHDMDLTRDRELYPREPDGDGEHGTGARVVVWKCPNCEMEYDRKKMELELAEIYQMRILAFQMQDIRCSKCRLAKAEFLRDRCVVCLSLVKDELNADVFLRRMKAFRSIGKVYGMGALERQADWFIQKEEGEWPPPEKKKPNDGKQRPLDRKRIAALIKWICSERRKKQELELSRLRLRS